MDTKNQIKFVDVDGSLEVVPMTPRFHKEPSNDNIQHLNEIKEVCDEAEEVKEAAEHKVEEVKEAAEHKVEEIKEAVEHKVEEFKEAAEHKAEEVKEAVEHNVKALENMEKQLSTEADKVADLIKDVEPEKMLENMKPKGCCIVQ